MKLHVYNMGDVQMTVLHDDEDRLGALARGVERASSMLKDLLDAEDRAAERRAPRIAKYLGGINKTDNG